MRRRILYVLFLLVFVPVGTEVAYRVLLRVQGEPYDATRARERIVEIASSVGPEAARPGDAEQPFHDPDTVLSPYTGFDYHTTNEQVVQDLALQDSEPASFDVLVTGGSVAVHVLQVAGPHIVDRLRAEPRLANRPVRLLGYARSAFKQPQQTTLLAWLFSIGLAPDVVVNLDGFNEAAIPHSNAREGYHPSFPHFDRWRTLTKTEAVDTESVRRLAELARRRDDLARAAAAALDAGVLLDSALVGRATLTRLARLRRFAAEAAEDFDAYASSGEEPAWRTGPPPPEDRDAVTDAAVRAWREGTLSIDALCARRGIPYAHVLQPAMRAPGAKRITSEEEASDIMGPTWGRGVIDGYPRMRAIGAQLAAEGLHFFDATNLFADVEETIYFDGCHMLERGNMLLGDEVARAVIAVLPP